MIGLDPTGGRGRPAIPALVGACWLALGAGSASADPVVSRIDRAPVDGLAIAVFAVLVALTLTVGHAMAWWMRGHRRAGGALESDPVRNGFAIAGEFMSAASLLGIAGLIYSFGFDGLVFSVGWLMGWPLILMLVADPLRNLGRYTFADVAALRFRPGPVRSFAAVGSLATVFFYLIAQMVGAGRLIQVLFGLPYPTAVIVVGVLMILYVTFGGLAATVWMQIAKALFLIVGTSALAFALVIDGSGSADGLFTRAAALHPAGPGLLAPGGFIGGPVEAVSLGCALMFGTAGLPHILMRFFTIADTRVARRAIMIATGLIGYFYLLTFVIGFGAIAVVLDAARPDHLHMPPGPGAEGFSVAQIVGGANMAAIHAADAVGGRLLFGLVSAVAFTTILTVVVGLMLAGATAIGRDLYALSLARGRAGERDELRVTRIAMVVVGAFSVVLGIAFEDHNVALIVSLAFTIAASGNFPVLMAIMYWRGTTTRGIVVGGWLGLGGALAMIATGPVIWRDLFGHERALFPYVNPGLFSMTLGFVGIWLASVTDRSAAGARERASYLAQSVQAQIGSASGGTPADPPPLAQDPPRGFEK